MCRTNKGILVLIILELQDWAGWQCRLLGLSNATHQAQNFIRKASQGTSTSFLVNELTYLSVSVYVVGFISSLVRSIHQKNKLMRPFI